MTSIRSAHTDASEDPSEAVELDANDARTALVVGTFLAVGTTVGLVGVVFLALA